ncbi:unnamed protein product [Nezara viridula]|uniref:Uncharacterized protein n=1 Tax=Nezara viridula TaxID=85310 RepID=A0A9P0H726_NEZVI|nr:unnamed protein product [Nezara viridula]
MTIDNRNHAGKKPTAIKPRIDHQLVEQEHGYARGPLSNSHHPNQDLDINNNAREHPYSMEILVNSHPDPVFDINNILTEHSYSMGPFVNNHPDPVPDINNIITEHSYSMYNEHLQKKKKELALRKKTAPKSTDVTSNPTQNPKTGKTYATTLVPQLTHQRSNKYENLLQKLNHHHGIHSSKNL